MTVITGANPSLLLRTNKNKWDYYSELSVSKELLVGLSPFGCDIYDQFASGNVF